ncbi:DUF5677 domain-containing protein [Micromonospora craniellae]|uniref:Uncharacterized protein n=1 Tax=Micromonospora craniellae TaxID=2294034 RepID=A0A372FRH2_9ACTN|nr:DUF5677 domain-containing protein [Micromonospora craniellae]QOC94354.1 hypothetical protein ID554_12620 [Micromonospora craniellae]RFS43341.1 hypothetical protein D0Q02_28400 [Micromonospora craniellae]
MAVNEDVDVEARVAAVEAWIAATKQALIIGDLTWDAAWPDLRRIAVNYILRRQLEALDATVVLAKVGLGHLAVGFVRPALDELLWMLWVKDLPQQDVQNLLMAMGRSDGIRSLLAQRAYVGDAVMQELWYPVTLLDAQEQQLTRVNDELAKIREQFNWSGRPLPSASWVAKQTGHKDLYDYLHAAASRALHFSMGEVLRNGWGEPGGKLVTLKPEFREYRTSFALYQLPLLFLETADACHEFFEHAGITELEDEALEKQILAAAQALGKFGRVPLVHAHEWNLTPNGPLGFTEKN